MAYTIPEYVDTQEQAILAVASAVKGEQVTGGDGNVGTALDILADALAGENVQVPMTQQGAILALAQYVSGGGGGVDLGPLGTVFMDSPSVEVGGSVTGGLAIVKLSVGNDVIAEATDGMLSPSPITNAAAGATVDAVYSYQYTEPLPTMVARTCTIDYETFTYATISEPIGMENETYAFEIAGETACVARFIMPELPEGAVLLLTAAYEDDE